MSNTSTINDQSCILRVELSTWTGKAKLTAGDLPAGTTLPPEELADLGTKRLIDPQYLRPFGKVKTRATRLMSQYAIRFLGGWLLDRQYLPKVEAELAVLKNEFDTALQIFVTDYNLNVKEWCREYPQWEHIIRNALPSSGDVRRRFGMSWQVYTIAPVVSPEGVQDGNDLADRIGNVATQVVENLAADVAALKEELFADRSSALTQRSLSPIRNLGVKCKRVALFNPEAAYVGDLLNGLADLDPKTAGSIIEMTLDQLSDSSKLQGLVDQWLAKGEAMFRQFAPTPAAPATPVSPAVSVEPETPLVEDPAQFIKDHFIVASVPPAKPTAPLQAVSTTSGKIGMDGLASLLDGLL